MVYEEDESRKAFAVKHEPDSGVIDIFDHVRVVFKYRRMIVLICVVAIVFAATISLLSPTIFSATTSIVPPMELLQRESGLAAGLLGTGEGAMLRRVMDITGIADMYVGILKSRAVIDAIIDRFDLINVYEKTETRSGTRRVLQRNTTIEVSEEGIVTIAVRDRDPNRAAAMANAYVEELDQQNKRLSVGQVTSKRIFLENRLKEVEERLSAIDNILSREAKIQEMLYELLIREYELAKIEEAKSMPTIQVLDEAVVPEARMPKGTLRKTALAGACSLVLGFLLALAREYFLSGGDETVKRRFSFMSKHRTNDSDFSELESKRKIVATQRRKCVPEHKSCSQQV